MTSSSILPGLVLAVATGALGQPATDPPPPPPGTERVLSYDRRDGGLLAVCAEIAGGPLDRDGRSVPRTEVWYTDGQSTVRKTATGLGTCDPDWSPDGRHLAVSSPEGLWVLFDVFEAGKDRGELLVDTRPVGRAATEFDYRQVSKPAWSPDGRRVALLASNGGTSWVAAYDVETGERLYQSEPETDEFAWGAEARSLHVGGRLVTLP